MQRGVFDVDLICCRLFPAHAINTESVSGFDASVLLLNVRKIATQGRIVGLAAQARAVIAAVGEGGPVDQDAVVGKVAGETKFGAAVGTEPVCEIRRPDRSRLRG